MASFRLHDLSRKLAALSHVTVVAPIVGAVATGALVIGLQFAPAKTTLSPKPATNHAAVKSASKPAATPQPAATKPAPTVTPPAAAVAPAPKKAAAAASSKPQPTVTPSPSSNVSGLTPQAPAAAPSSSASAPPVTTGYTSTNWSGYLATNGTFSAVSGSWVVPHVSGNGSTTTADSSWIGIGGVTSGDLIQVGTQNIISANGTVSTSAFYEMLPAVSQLVPGVTVNAGDSMSASVSQLSAGQWSITITDNTNGQSFTTSVAYSSSLSSAEWIEEDPSFSFHRLIPFDNFGGVNFAGGSATENGSRVSIVGSNALPVTMQQNGQTVAMPSAIGGDGASFSVSP